MVLHEGLGGSQSTHRVLASVIMASYCGSILCLDGLPVCFFFPVHVGCMWVVDVTQCQPWGCVFWSLNWLQFEAESFPGP